VRDCVQGPGRCSNCLAGEQRLPPPRRAAGRRRSRERGLLVTTANQPTPTNSKQFPPTANPQEVSDWLEQHPPALAAVVAKGLTAARAADAAKRARELVRRKNVLTRSTLPGKLADCTSSNKEETEIFVVEGDSAGGSAKQARDRRSQVGGRGWVVFCVLLGWERGDITEYQLGAEELQMHPHPPCIPNTPRPTARPSSPSAARF
jgi:hypothetical protein